MNEFPDSADEWMVVVLQTYENIHGNIGWTPKIRKDNVVPFGSFLLRVFGVMVRTSGTFCGNLSVGSIFGDTCAQKLNDYWNGEQA